MNISIWQKSFVQEMSKRSQSRVWVFGIGFKVLNSRSCILILDLESQVLHRGTWILDSKFRVLGPSPFNGHYKVWQKNQRKVWQVLQSLIAIAKFNGKVLVSVTGIPKYDRYCKVWQKSIVKCDRYYKVWQDVITKWDVTYY